MREWNLMASFMDECKQLTNSSSSFIPPLPSWIHSLIWNVCIWITYTSQRPHVETLELFFSYWETNDEPWWIVENLNNYTLHITAGTSYVAYISMKAIYSFRLRLGPDVSVSCCSRLFGTVKFEFVLPLSLLLYLHFISPFFKFSHSTVLCPLLF